jgi:hypothetical protein
MLLEGDEQSFRELSRPEQLDFCPFWHPYGTLDTLVPFAAAPAAGL